MLRTLHRHRARAFVTRSTSLAAAGLALLLISPAPARANCYEIFGCTNSQYFSVGQLKTASCQILWEMRNTIYKENGYCFHTQRAIKAFGNAGCLHDDAAKVPLNKAEKHNVSAIKQAERAKGCA